VHAIVHLGFKPGVHMDKCSLKLTLLVEEAQNQGPTGSISRDTVI